MGVISNEDQEKRGQTIGAFFIGLLLAIPFLNLLTGFILVIQWAGRVITQSSNITKDLGMLVVFFIAIAASSYGGMYFFTDSHSSDSNWIWIIAITFFIGMFGSKYLMQHIDALSD